MNTLENIVWGGGKTYSNNPVIVCKNGTELSVQASHFHYCTPKMNNDQFHGSYTHVEVGFPTSSPPDSWSEFRVSGNDDIFARVPVQMVRDYIESHGGEMCEQ
jgi:hypothetical protein